MKSHPKNRQEVKVIGDNSELKINVFKCSQCGEDHKSVGFNSVSSPTEDSLGIEYNWVGTCPVTGNLIWANLLARGRADGVPDLVVKYAKKEVRLKGFLWRVLTNVHKVIKKGINL